MGQPGLGKVRQILQFPIITTRQETSEDNGITLISNTFIPAKWDFGTSARMIETADKLHRLALGMDTSRTAEGVIVEETEVIGVIQQKRWQSIATELAELLSVQAYREEDTENGTGENERLEIGNAVTGIYRSQGWGKKTLPFKMEK